MRVLSMKLLVRSALLFPVLGLLPACSILPKNQEAPSLYQLHTKMEPSHEAMPESAAARLPYQIVVQAPLAALSLDTNRIAALTNEHEVKYLRGVRWTDNAPRMVQDALIESFAATNRFAAVARASGGLRTDYSVMTELQDFQADLSTGLQPVVRISMTVQLVKQPVGDVVAAQSFHSDIAAEGRSTTFIVRAFDAGLQVIMGEIGPWAAKSLPQPKPVANEASRATTPQRKASRESEPAPTP